MWRLPMPLPLPKMCFPSIASALANTRAAVIVPCKWSACFMYFNCNSVTSPIKRSFACVNKHKSIYLFIHNVISATTGILATNSENI